jgi:hypothetical protein
MSHQVLDGIFVLLILLVVGLLLSIRRWPEWFRLARSARWPTVPGTIEGGEVSTRRGRSRYGDEAIETATANLAYSYRLNGTYYSGYHIAVFDDEQEAWSYVDGLKGETVQVSYHPRRPDISVLRPQAVLGF